jgi:hypothetical protein
LTYPDSWTFTTVQQVKLDSGFVDNSSSEPIKGIDFPKYRPLSYASKARVAGARPQVVEFRGDERGASAASRCRRARLGAGMATTNDDNIIWSIT